MTRVNQRSKVTPGSSPPPSLQKPDRGVTPRVVILALLLGVLFGYVNPTVDFRFFNSYLGGSHLPAGAVGTLLVLLLVVNPLLRLISKRLAFSRNETLTVYITCLFSCLVPGRGGGFSVEAPEGLRFLSRGRAFTDAENRALDATPPVTGADYERGVRPPPTGTHVVAEAVDACPLPATPSR